MVGVLGTTVTALYLVRLNLSQEHPFSLYLSLSLAFFPSAVPDRNIKQMGKNAHAIMIYDDCMQGAQVFFNDPGSRQEEERGIDRGVNRYNHTAFICRYAYDEQVPLIRACRKCSRMHDHNTHSLTLIYNTRFMNIWVPLQQRSS